MVDCMNILLEGKEFGRCCVGRLGRQQKMNILLLLISFVMLYQSFSIFPVPSNWTLSMILAELIFQPFKLLGSVCLFICGFITNAYVIRKVIAKSIIKKKAVETSDILILTCMGAGFIYLTITQTLFALLALGLSLFYGIMDVDFEKNKEKKDKMPL